MKYPITLIGTGRSNLLDRQTPGTFALVLVLMSSVVLTDWSDSTSVTVAGTIQPEYWLEGYLQARHILIKQESETMEMPVATPTSKGFRGIATDEQRIVSTDIVAPSDMGAPDLPSRPFRSIATYYADAYHGQEMADGEIFDMYDPTTTASNWWALGTTLWVTHGENGRSVIVTVTDRGLFNHALDLSWAAFQQLDNPAVGVIPVEIEVLD